MRWQFWQKPESKHLSRQVKKALVAQFPINEQEMAGMRMVGKRGHFSGKRATLIRVFDPALLENGTVAPPVYDDFKTDRDALLFEGHIQKILDEQQVFIHQVRVN